MVRAYDQAGNFVEAQAIKELDSKVAWALAAVLLIIAIILAASRGRGKPQPRRRKAVK